MTLASMSRDGEYENGGEQGHWKGQNDRERILTAQSSTRKRPCLKTYLNVREAMGKVRAIWMKVQAKECAKAIGQGRSVMKLHEKKMV